MTVGHDWRTDQARKSVARILPEVEKDFAAERQRSAQEWHKFSMRLNREWDLNYTNPEVFRAFNAMARIVAPAVPFKSETNVHPGEVVR